MADTPTPEKEVKTKYTFKKKFVTDKKLYNVGDEYKGDNADVITFLKSNGYI